VADLPKWKQGTLANETGTSLYGNGFPGGE
jgi:hypothetical protein